MLYVVGTNLNLSLNYPISKPQGRINTVTEIREHYQDPNPFPPRRPIIYRLADTLEKVS